MSTVIVHYTFLHTYYGYPVLDYDHKEVVVSYSLVVRIDSRGGLYLCRGSGLTATYSNMPSIMQRIAKWL